MNEQFVKFVFKMLYYEEDELDQGKAEKAAKILLSSVCTKTNKL